MWDALCRSQPTILPSSEVFGLFHIGCTAEYFHYIWFSWATWASPKTSPRCSQCEFSNLLTRVHVWNGPFCDFNCWHSFTPPHRPERDKAAFWRKHHHWQQIDFLFCVVFSFFSLSSFSLSPWTLSACPLFSPILHCVPIYRYRKTQETLSQAGQVTSAALSSMGAAITQRIGTMRWYFLTS